MKLLAKEKIGNKRIIHILGIKFEYEKNKKYKAANEWYQTLENALGNLRHILGCYGYDLSFKENACVDAEGNPIPWFTYPSIEYLKQFNYTDKRVFEYGSGNSSLFWADRVKEIISVEDNEEWYNSRLAFKKDNLNMILRNVDTNAEKYANEIFNHEGLFDIIVIDGTLRDLCAKAAIEKLAPGGFIIFDNSERANDVADHREAFNYLKSKNYIQVDFYGVAPLNGYVHTTSLFFSRDFNFKTLQEIQPAKSIGMITEN